MEHVVFYPAATGVPAFRRVGSLDEAVNFVEHLRNAENITEFSVQALTPVQLSFRAYYHAEVPVEQASEPAVVGTAAAVPEPSEPAAEVDASAEVAAEDVPSVAAADAADDVVAEADSASDPEETVAVEAPAEAADVAEVVEVEPVAEVETVVEPEPVVEVEPVAEVETVAEVEPVAEAEDVAVEDVAVEDVETPAVVVEDNGSEPEAAGPAAEDEVSVPPVEATDDDRSAEWVAEAPVVEGPVEVPVVESSAVPGVVADEPAAVVEPEPAPAAQRALFGDAPPVTVPVVEAETSDAASDTEAALDPANGDIVPALAPSGRRSLGFFAR
jgi:hypothetical protein